MGKTRSFAACQGGRRIPTRLPRHQKGRLGSLGDETQLTAPTCDTHGDLAAHSCEGETFLYQRRAWESFDGFILSLRMMRVQTFPFTPFTVPPALAQVGSAKLSPSRSDFREGLRLCECFTPTLRAQNPNLSSLQMHQDSFPIPTNPFGEQFFCPRPPGRGLNPAPQ